MTDRAYDSRVPPQAAEVEVAVLGACMLAPDALPVVLGLLDADHFYVPKHGLIYGAMYRLAFRGEPVDMATVASELEKSGELVKVGGANYLIDVASSVFTTANVEAHAKIVAEKAALRKAILQATSLIEACHDHPGSVGDLLAEFQGRLSTVAIGLTRQRNSCTLTTLMGGVVSEAIEWLWYPYVPLGKLTILEGDPGVGKTFVALQIAAIVSRGFAFPNHSGQPAQKALPPSAVVVMNAEDGLADTLRPRLDAARADCAKIVALTGIREGHGPTAHERQITLSDIPELEAIVVEHHPALVLVDPLQAYLGAGIDMHRANETRPILSGLASMADRQRCAILCVRHLAKSRADKAMYQGLGSIDFSGAARSIIRAGHDPNDESKRLIAHVKCSVAPCGPSIGYEIGNDGFMWTGVSSVTADDMSAPRARADTGAVDKASDWLQGILGDGPVAANEVQALARRQGIGDRALSTAKKMLTVESAKSGAIWTWKLPQ
jgi:hypothetical protein